MNTFFRTDGCKFDATKKEPVSEGEDLAEQKYIQ